jgi:hypothetical protein
MPPPTLVKKEGLLDAQARIDRSIEQYRQEQTNFRAGLEVNIEQSRLTANERADIRSKIAAFGNLFSEQLALVQRDPNVPADSKDTIIRQLWDEHQKNLTMMADLSGLVIAWDETAPATTEQIRDVTETATAPKTTEQINEQINEETGLIGEEAASPALDWGEIGGEGQTGQPVYNP